MKLVCLFIMEQFNAVPAIPLLSIWWDDRFGMFCLECVHVFINSLTRLHGGLGIRHQCHSYTTTPFRRQLAGGL
uniref:Putative secreted protein n=1 Tax=Anopheles darlingi TaxID=43151 RepID=A0A2M4DGT3_ANODA